MFRKLVSSLPYSPAMAGQLEPYAERLNKEQAARRLGLIFVALTLVVQSFAIFSPPEQTLVASQSAVLPNGVSSPNQVVEAYDAGENGQNDFSSLMNYFGITRNELQSASTANRVCSDDHSITSVSRQHHYNTAEGELVHQVPVGGSYTTFYSAPLFRFDQATHQINCYDVLVGNSQKAGWFAIDRASGNLQIKQSTLKLPSASFTNASCTTIQGYAYDQRAQDQKVKVYLYFGGAPGKGEPYGPIVANTTDPSSPGGNGHGFKFSVPDKYRASGQTTVWGVMQPAAGWTGPDVQFSNTVQIPGNCKTEGAPIITCHSLQTNIIERNKLTFTAFANNAQGASINGYEYIVTDKNGKIVIDKQYSSSTQNHTTDVIDFSKIEPGQYTVKTIVKTNHGDIQDDDCTKTITLPSANACIYNAAVNKDDPSCQPCQYDSTLYAQDENCIPQTVLSKEAKNISRGGANADLATALPGDRIQFDLRTTNLSQQTINTTIQEDISDILEYAFVMQDGGGAVDPNTNTISWNNIPIKSGETDTRTFVIQINDVIASAPRAANEPAAYDCAITNSYGNTINIFMACPVGKVVENTIKQLPTINIATNIVFSTLLLLIVSYLYARSRQISRELRIVRNILSKGGPM